MRLLFFVSNLSYPPIEGTHNQTLQLIEYLSESGFTVSLAGFKKKNVKFDYENFRLKYPSILINDLKEYTGNYIFLAIKNLFLNKHSFKNMFKNDYFDIVHFEGFGVISCYSFIDSSKKIISLIDPWSIRQKFRAKQSNKIGKKIIFLFGFLISYLFEWYYLKRYKKVHLVSISDSRKLELMHNIRNIISIPIFVENIHIVPKNNYLFSQPNKATILIWCDLAIDYLSDSFLWFVDEIYPYLNDHYDIKICVFSRLEKIKYVQIIHRDLPDNFIFYEWVADINREIRNMDLAIFCDLFGTGLKNRVIQTMMNGVPIIGSQPALDGIGIKSEVNAYQCYTKEDFIKNCSLLIENEKLRQKIGNNGYFYCLNTFSKEKIMSHWLEFYNSL